MLHVNLDQSKERAPKKALGAKPHPVQNVLQSEKINTCHDLSAGVGNQ